MKNGSKLLLLICALSFALVIGIFIGRNVKSDYAQLPESIASETAAESQTQTQTQTQTDYRLDINTATKVQLMELPGIGEKIADRIIAYRTQNGAFSSTDELMNVEGIGEKKLLQIESLIKAGG